MSDYRDKYVKCPFYAEQEARKIKCCGFAAGNHIHIVFDTAEAKERHVCSVCNRYGYKRCPVYKMIEKEIEGREQ